MVKGKSGVNPAQPPLLWARMKPKNATVWN